MTEITQGQNLNEWYVPVLLQPGPAKSLSQLGYRERLRPAGVLDTSCCGCGLSLASLVLVWLLLLQDVAFLRCGAQPLSYSDSNDAAAEPSPRSSALFDSPALGDGGGIISTNTSVAAPPRAASDPRDVGKFTFRVTFEVSRLSDGSNGTFVMEVHPFWAPLGVERFVALLQTRFFEGVGFFRVIEGFVAQFGLSGDPAVNRKWDKQPLQDDWVFEGNTRGRVSYATAGKNTRSTQIFVNYKDNGFLNAQGFSPFAEVVEGMDVLDRLYMYRGNPEPDQGEIDLMSALGRY